MATRRNSGSIEESTTVKEMSAFLVPLSQFVAPPSQFRVSIPLYTAGILDDPMLSSVRELLKTIAFSLNYVCVYVLGNFVNNWLIKAQLYVCHTQSQLQNGLENRLSVRHLLLRHSVCAI